MAARLVAVHPVLASSDVEASVAFYRRLGFAETFRDRPSAPAYAAVTRDAVTLHLQWHADASSDPGRDRPVYRILCEDVDELYETLRAAGAVPRGEASRSPYAHPADTPWGTRELHLRDPDGNGLQLYRPR